MKPRKPFPPRRCGICHGRTWYRTRSALDKHSSGSTATGTVLEPIVTGRFPPTYWTLPEPRYGGVSSIVVPLRLRPLGVPRPTRRRGASPPVRWPSRQKSTMLHVRRQPPKVGRRWRPRYRPPAPRLRRCIWGPRSTSTLQLRWIQLIRGKYFRLSNGTNVRRPNGGASMSLAPFCPISKTARTQTVAPICHGPVPWAIKNI